MGVDWVRMRPKSGAGADELRALARAEGLAYQSCDGWYPVSEAGSLRPDIGRALHETALAAATAGVRARVELAGWDHDRGCAADVPDLVPSWRVAVIAGNPAFPPLDRCRAFRTIPPDELPDQLAAWRRWVEDAGAGRHDTYLRDLHWYGTADWARYHWSVLHENAVRSFAAAGAWAKRPALAAVRDDILRLPEPVVPRVAVTPDRMEKGGGGPLAAKDYRSTLEAARALAELTRRWDGCVRGNQKLRYYEDCYKFTLDEFRAHLAGAWLAEFFAWADRCVAAGFGWCVET